MPRHTIEAIGLSDAGAVRQFNEDRVVVDAPLGIVALADGMGGHRAGDVAAHMAADIVWSSLRARLAQANAGQQSLLLAVNSSINQANQAIHEAAQASGSREGMGTTLAVAVFDGDSVVLGHVGDSRIYRLRDDRLTLLTRDDSLVREAVDQGLISASDAAGSHNRSLVTQALGVAPDVEANVRSADLRDGDVYMLCSDGLTDLVAHDDIELIVNTLKVNLGVAVRTLVDTAKDNGGYDNVSVILARVSSASNATRTGWLARLLAALFGERR
jgi:PPM family protein phosphatase